jgi:hypothetical protein
MNTYKSDARNWESVPHRSESLQLHKNALTQPLAQERNSLVAWGWEYVVYGLIFALIAVGFLLGIAKNRK